VALLLLSFFKIAYILFIIITITLLVITIYAGIIQYAQNYVAKYFILGNLFIGVSGIIHVLSNHGIGNLKFGAISNFVGVIAELIVFSFAISKKFSVLSEEKVQMTYESQLKNKQLEFEKNARQNLEFELEEKTRSLASTSIQWININEKLDQLKKKINTSNLEESKQFTREIDEIKTFKNHWKNFKLHFEQVHPGFFKWVETNYPKLSKNDIRLLALMKMQLTNQEIGIIMNITKRSVEQAKRRMRIKMVLEQESDIINEIGYEESRRFDSS
ncbi:MAG: hypothetical protein AAFY41_02260, partial [Bacteroidota bacterium]